MDAVVTTSAGHPLDLTFYQAVKGITAASHVVKPGGTILLMAECSEGAGAEEFSQLLARFETPEAYLAQLDKSAVTVDQWQLEKLALVLRNYTVLFYVPGLPRQFHAHLGGPSFETAAEAIQFLDASLAADAEVAILPEGPYVFARPQAPEGQLVSA